MAPASSGMVRLTTLRRVEDPLPGHLDHGGQLLQQVVVGSDQLGLVAQELAVGVDGHGLTGDADDDGPAQRTRGSGKPAAWSRRGRSARGRHPLPDRRSAAGSLPPDRPGRRSRARRRRLAAAASFSSRLSTAKTSTAPNALASWTAERPSPPIPNTAALSPALSLDFRSAWNEVAEAHISVAPCSKGISCGSTSALRAGTDDELRVPAVGEVAEHETRRAELLVPRAAEITVPAGDVVVEADPVARAHVRHRRGADLLHDARHLVPQRHGQGPHRRGACPVVHVGMADARRAHPHQDVPWHRWSERADRRARAVFQRPPCAQLSWRPV